MRDLLLGLITILLTLVAKSIATMSRNVHTFGQRADSDRAEMIRLLQYNRTTK